MSRTQSLSFGWSFFLLLVLAGSGVAQSVGADVTYLDCDSVEYWGQQGGVHGYSLQSDTCNIGDENLLWGSVTPLLGMNAYKYEDGRLRQIGMSWLKNGTTAFAGNGPCGSCNGQGGSVLGAGCLDVYGAGFNGFQSILGRRSDCNAFTGDYPGVQAAGSGAIAKRLQIDGSDLTAGGTYYIEGVYVAPDDALARNAMNNASYKQVNLAGFELNPIGSMNVGFPAIYAWQDQDPSVEIQTFSAPSEGTYFVASKVTDLGGGEYRYDYAIFNLNSHISGAAFEIPLSGALATDIGFNDVDYHSGEIYDNTDWNSSTSGDAMRWSSPQTFAENPNTNALRFATMYNFWFTANAPSTTGDATFEFFRPTSPSSITISLPVPEGVATPDLYVRGDCNGDASVNVADPVFLLSALFPSGDPAPTPGCDDACDGNDDGTLNIGDAIAILNVLFSGTVMPNPYPTCGEDPTTGDSLGCETLPSCP